jgi:hypothetical protein
MRLKVSIYIILSIFLIIAILYSRVGQYQIPHYEKLADTLTTQTAKKLAKEKGLALCGTGGGMMDDIKMMAMSFNYYKEVDLNSARKLLVEAVSEYLTAINNNKELRPFLHNYPFTPENVKIYIWIYKPDGKDLPPDKIDFLYACNGKLLYYTERPGKYSPAILF